jgi:hypothetical protein
VVLNGLTDGIHDISGSGASCSSVAILMCHNKMTSRRLFCRPGKVFHTINGCDFQGLKIAKLQTSSSCARECAVIRVLS